MDILFRDGSDKKVVTLSDEVLDDLAIPEIIEAITIREEEQIILKKIFSEIPQDLEDTKYRQEIMADILGNDNLAFDLGEALGSVKILRDYSNRAPILNTKEQSVFKLLEDMRELSVYIDSVEKIYECLEKAELSSKGLIGLRDELGKIIKSEDFNQAKDDVKRLLSELSEVKSIMVGINLTPDLNIEEIVDVEFCDYYFKPRVTFEEVLSKISIIGAASHGSGAQGPDVPGNSFDIYHVDPIMTTLAPLMDKRLKKYYRVLKNTLIKHLNIDGYFITDLMEGLVFYVLMAKFAKRLRGDGHKICTPALNDSRVFKLSNFYNVRLAIRREEDIVLNDFEFLTDERIFILTGPNRGGKTIIEQAVGIASLMSAVGGFVTADECTGTPFKNILTHFPQDENLTINYGRLGEEAIRTKEIARVADSDTLVLCNETYSTTSSDDGLYLSRDLLHVLKDKGVAVIFNTHIHELASQVDEMNEWDGESKIVSVVMEIVNEQNTFKIKKSAPDRNSHARNVALKYGITYEQMTEQ